MWGWRSLDTLRIWFEWEWTGEPGRRREDKKCSNTYVDCSLVDQPLVVNFEMTIVLVKCWFAL